MVCYYAQFRHPLRVLEHIPTGEGALLYTVYSKGLSLAENSSNIKAVSTCIVCSQPSLASYIYQYSIDWRLRLGQGFSSLRVDQDHHEKMLKISIPRSYLQEFDLADRKQELRNMNV